jgi:hypothetical protein
MLSRYTVVHGTYCRIVSLAVGLELVLLGATIAHGQSSASQQPAVISPKDSSAKSDGDVTFGFPLYDMSSPSTWNRGEKGRFWIGDWDASKDCKMVCSPADKFLNFPVFDPSKKFGNYLTQFGYSFDSPLPTLPQLYDSSTGSEPRGLQNTGIPEVKAYDPMPTEVSAYRKYFTENMNENLICRLMASFDRFKGHISTDSCSDGKAMEQGVLDIEVRTIDPRSFKYKLYIIGVSSLLALQQDKAIERHEFVIRFGFDFNLVPTLYFYLDSSEVRAGNSIEPLIDNEFRAFDRGNDTKDHAFADDLGSTLLISFNNQSKLHIVQR